MTIALEELKAAGVMLESVGFLRRFTLRERIATRALVREALGLKAAGPTTPAEPPIAEEELLQRYIRHLKVEEGRVEHTIVAYRQGIAAFRAFLAKRYLKLKEATREDVLAFKEELLEKGNCAKTINLRMAALRSLYSFLFITREVEIDPMRNVRKLPEERKRLAVLTPGEVDRFIKAIDRTTPGGLRDYALVILLFATGGRIGEVTTLRVQDIDLSAACSRSGSGRTATTTRSP
jgi:integrase/recombinase XerD